MARPYVRLAIAVLAQALSDLQTSKESRRLFFSKSHRQHLDILLAMAGLERHQMMDFVDKASKTKRKASKSWYTALERSSAYD